MPNKKAIFTKILQMRFKQETVDYAESNHPDYLSTELRRLTELGVEADKKLKSK